LIFCDGRAMAEARGWGSPLGFMSRAMAAAAALMSCSEWVAVGEQPLTGAIRMCWRIWICKLALARTLTVLSL